jgi:2-polyprenyl-3-methyl-5-hydroxy-6-metoxy-1,4-benzoquinol methylase
MSERCPACGADGRPLSLVVQDRYRLYACRNCKTQYFREARTGDPTSVDSEYWEPHKYAFYSDPSVRAAFARRYDGMVATAERTIGPVRSVLDVGCGTGNFLDYARRRDMDAWGVDLDPEPVAEARSRGLQAVAMADIDSAGLPDTFDALTMWDVIEHIVDPLGALKDVLPRLKPGGALLFETPDGGFPLRRAVLAAHRASNGRLDYTPPLYYWEHKIYFTARGFRALMQRLGCEVVDLRRGTSIREKMDAVLAYEAEETGSRWVAALSKTWPVLARAAQTTHIGNKLLVVARKR